MTRGLAVSAGDLGFILLLEFSYDHFLWLKIEEILKSAECLTYASPLLDFSFPISNKNKNAYKL